VEVAEAGAFVQGDDAVIEVLKEEERARLVGGLEVFDGLRPCTPFDAYADVTFHQAAHAEVEGLDLRLVDRGIVVKVMEKAGADGHSRHEATFRIYLLGGYR
jgi:hypothetical protein